MRRRPGCYRCGEQELPALPFFLSRRRINMTASSNAAARALSEGYRTSRKPNVKTYTDAPGDAGDGRRAEVCEECGGRARAPAAPCMAAAFHGFHWCEMR
ncbi:hypothetical protein MTO96_000774 [Rhipicephalus appendiculatus]